MAFSLVIDDTSLVLIFLIVTALSLSIYVSRAYQPLIHPLILSRQSDVSQVRQPGQSATYRNANSPSGFQLAQKPRKEVVSIPALLSYGATGSHTQTKRQVYNVSASNADISEQASAFAAGLVKLGSAPVQQTSLAISTESDSFQSLIALIAGSHLAAAGRYHTLVIPPHATVQRAPSELPEAFSSSGNRTISALFSTSSALNTALSLGSLDASALVIVPTFSDVQQAEENVKQHVGGSHRMRIKSFSDVLEAGRGEAPDSKDRDDLASVHSHYWQGTAGWVAVSYGSLISGVTAHLGFFPADKIPTATDRIFVEASAAPLGAVSSPAGLALSLLALYTCSHLASSTTTSSYDDPNPAVSQAFAEYEPTLIYASDEGASSLACALASVTRKSPLASVAARNKLYTLRNGTYSRQGTLDNMVYNKARALTGSSKVRNVTICGPGSTVAQSLLDSLRSHFGCSVLNAYLPAKVTASEGTSASAVTAPVSASHSYDLQAFADHEHAGMQVPAHVGPPSVAVEVKIVETAAAKERNMTIAGEKPDGYQGDPMGEIFVRGKTLTGDADENEWQSTGDMGGFRSNGTLVVLRDSADSDPVAIPTLSARKPVIRQTRSKAGKVTASATTLSILAMLGLCGSLVQPTGASDIRKRALNNTLVDVARMGMLSAQRASWEQGIGQSALLELDNAGWSVFTSNNGGPPYKPSNVRTDAGNVPYDVLAMAYHSASRQDSLGRMSFRITGDERLETGSALDGASCGEHVLLAGWINGEVNQRTGAVVDGFFADSARRQLDYILEEAPRSCDGAISHRSMSVALWSDGVYMGPPFIAYFGLLTRNDSLLQIAYDQIRLYRDGLRLESGAAQDLWGHIYFPDNGTWSDAGAWATGNGWVTAGMMRVLATIQQSEASDAMSEQKDDLIQWTSGILDAAYSLLDQDSLLFHNYMNDTSTFLDAAGTAMLVYSTFRLAALSPDNARHVDMAEQIYNSLQRSLTPLGVYRPDVLVVDVLGFTHEGPTSSESLSFIMLMDAARRDYRNGDTVRIRKGDSNAAATSRSPISLLWVMVTVLMTPSFLI